MKESNIYTTLVPTVLGDMFVACTENKILLLCSYDTKYINQQLHSLKKLYNAEIIEQKNDVAVALQKELDEYFEGKRRGFSVALELNGTPFEQECYKTLLNIPYGKTISYKEEAQMIGNPKAYRAVANANAHNRLEILVPCHRVIQANGKLGGYSGGIEKKIFLLDLEKRVKAL
ncbi:MAG: methylated-DNA--[protein]-cysteine S-methyltransferase [Sulfurimonadaceae bacterium]|jgi:O-6-methylguanine DNA methyltransferase|nr:methylated-DNA--[protein]-cysteine S-methyltransferase [Sulfurimonadaceae bacterium]